MPGIEGAAGRAPVAITILSAASGAPSTSSAPPSPKWAAPWRVASGVEPGHSQRGAVAQHLPGDSPAAMETEKKALALPPPDAAGGGDYEAARARFEAGLKAADDAEEPGEG